MCTTPFLRHLPFAVVLHTCVVGSYFVLLNRWQHNAVQWFCDYNLRNFSTKFSYPVAKLQVGFFVNFKPSFMVLFRLRYNKYRTHFIFLDCAVSYTLFFPVHLWPSCLAMQVMYWTGNTKRVLWLTVQLKIRVDLISKQLIIKYCFFFPGAKCKCLYHIC